VSLYVQVAIGAGRYLLDAERVLEIRARTEDDPTMPRVDLRRLFAAPEAAGMSAVLVAQSGGEVALLAVDRVEGLVEIADAALCRLPPIGPLGMLIDAAVAGANDEPPLLRLRGERALIAAAGG